MLKRSLTYAALTGVVAGFAATSPLKAGEQSSAKKENSPTPDPFMAMKEVDAQTGNLNYHLMSEEELLLELDDDGTKLYSSLNSDGKRLARFVASQRCAKSNACQGLNACQTADHTCAGKGTCRMTTKCGMADKNLAVKLVTDLMEKKRAAAASIKT